MSANIKEYLKLLLLQDGGRFMPERALNLIAPVVAKLHMTKFFGWLAEFLKALHAGD